ncbi:MAG TPA: hypothetical protein VKQ52_11555 [Puia sp.]|nr:hypothetical protein [Puia sp.]
MINTIDLAECEVLLPGDWVQKGSGDIYSFTSDKMELRDQRLFRELYILEKGKPREQPIPYALTIKDDYCGILVGEEEFIILSITGEVNGSATMEWQDAAGRTLGFDRAAAPA